MPYLCSLLEPWLRELGSREALGKWLRVKDYRDEVKEAILRGKWYMREAFSPVVNPRWAQNIYVVKSRSPGIEGKSIAQIAEERGKDQLDTWFDVITEDPDTRGVTGQLLPRECYNLYYTHPAGMVGLDTSVFDDKYQANNPPYTIPGINTFSAYPLFYIKYVRDGRLFSLEEAVKKTSTMPAKVHNLQGRGTIERGGYADIVLLDLPKLKVLSTELEPRRHPKGVEYVLVNGVTVVEKGRHTGARPGRVLKRTG